MDWTMIGAIGELVGGAAVVLSLLYVARQLGRSTRQARVEAYHSVLSEVNAFAATLANDADCADIWWRAMDGLSGLTDAERIRFHALLFTLFRSWEKLFHYHRAGELDDWSAEGVHQTLGDMTAYRGLQEYWGLRKHWYSTEFQEWVDAIISGGEQTDIYREKWSSIGE